MIRRMNESNKNLNPHIIADNSGKRYGYDTLKLTELSDIADKQNMRKVMQYLTMLHRDGNADDNMYDLISDAKASVARLIEYVDRYAERMGRMAESVTENYVDDITFVDNLIGLSYEDAVEILEKKGFTSDEYGIVGGGVPKSGAVEYVSYVNGDTEIVIKYRLVADRTNPRTLLNGDIIDAYEY